MFRDDVQHHDLARRARRAMVAVGSLLGRGGAVVGVFVGADRDRHLVPASDSVVIRRPCGGQRARLAARGTRTSLDIARRHFVRPGATGAPCL